MSKKLFYLISFVLVSGLIADVVHAGALMGYWAFDEGAGDIAHDSSGNENHGTLVGTGLEWVTGHFNGALNFNGGAGYVQVPDGPILNPTDEITIAAWVNPTWTGNNRILQKGSSDNQYRFLRENGDNFVFHLAIVSNSRLEGIACPPENEWHHVAGTYDGSAMKIFYDAQLMIEHPASGAIATSADSLFIGTKHATAPAGDYFYGVMDEVCFFNRALTVEQLQSLVNGVIPKFPNAYQPDPPYGGIHEDTWVSLQWSPGDYAVSHDVYFGDNFVDVNDGAPDSSGFQGNQAATNFVVGFPGFPYPDGLVPGTTYYWRIDEVNDTEPNSPWKGKVWSFTVPPKTTYDPIPADGAKFVDSDIELSWTAGFGAKLHTVYFGDNFDEVNNAAVGLPQGTTTYALDALELDKTYYWRVDEFDAITTHKGNVWSFTTACLGGGVRADYYRGMNFESHVLTRIDPQINFHWGNAAPDEAVGEDQFSVRWTGEVKAVFTETYTFYTKSDDGVRLWVDGQQLVDNWTNHGPTENRGKSDLVAGQTYSVVMEHYEYVGGALAELRWSSPRTPKQLIPQAALSLPVRASRSRPSNGAVDVTQKPILRWTAGDLAASHQVYFGTDAEAVKNADTGSPEYKGNRDLGSESYDPGKLQWDTTYYWRVDEVNNVNPDSPWTGNIWSFTTADFLIVDDFESYNDLDPDDPESNRIFNTWIDGWDDPTNGSLIGWIDPPFVGRTIAHTGKQSMSFYYDNSGPANYSEATANIANLEIGQDWTIEDVVLLSLWFRGNSDNAPELMYVALANSDGAPEMVFHENPNATQRTTWTEWIIDLQAFADQGVDLTNVNTIALGLGNRNNPLAGGSGTMYFDDIRLYPPPPAP